MPKFTANDYLMHNGSIVEPDKEVELTAEQAERLGDKVTAVEAEKEEGLADKTVPELKKLAEELQIDGFDGLKKPELLKAIEEKQKAEA